MVGLRLGGGRVALPFGQDAGYPRGTIAPSIVPQATRGSILVTASNKTLSRALDPRANGTWLSKLTE